MSMFKDNKTFYPTPKKMVERMIAMIKGRPKNILEPSAGKGDIVEIMQGIYKTSKYGTGQFHGYRPFSNAEFSAIEIDETLQATLRGKNVSVIDSDFLAYSGQDKFDLVIANPPFDEGDKHLLKAIDIMYRGEIVFLLNAETIRNPHTNSRKLLCKKLDELGAKVKYYKNAFAVDAERKTQVDVAMVYIKIDGNVEDDLFAGADDEVKKSSAKVKTKGALSTGKTIEELVAEYNEIIRLGTETIIAYYKNYKKVGCYLSLNDVGGKDRSYTDDDLTDLLQANINGLLKQVRTVFWRKTLNLSEVSSRMTKKKMDEFEHALQDRCKMDFTERNIRQFVLNLIGGYEQTLIEAVLDIFDMFTVRHCFRDDDLHEKNIHYFNGWKTNNAFKVGKKVIIPIHAGYGGPFFCHYNNKFELDHNAARILNDIDIVMRYFDGLNGDIRTISEALKISFRHGINRNVESTYFYITAHKKGTIHLTFKDMDILRRFNVCACRGKGWLPQDYGHKKYARLTHEEQAVVEDFEGEKTYNKKVGQPVFALPANLKLIE